MQNGLKPLNQTELENTVDEISQTLGGAQLQDILTNDRGVALIFRGAGAISLIVDLSPNTPQLLMFRGETPFRKHPKAKPMGLFLNSHAKNLYFKGIEVLPEFGRVVCLYLGNTQSVCEIEIRLIPKQSNLIVTSGDKKISWQRPLALSPPPAMAVLPEARSLDTLRQIWKEALAAPKPGSLDPKVIWEKQRDRDLAKKKKALATLQEQLETENHVEWMSLGEHLKSYGFQNLPENLNKLVQQDKGISWNIEECFRKAKQMQAKRDGAQNRVVLLQQEIEALEKMAYSSKSLRPAPESIMKKASARGRKLQLRSGLEAYCGRSAKDNLALLRQAKAWDYWLHLRDYPGAHAIVRRKRDQMISDSEFDEVAQWVARESLPGKSLIPGQRLDVVIAECRFVRPIKGDKLGRVNFHSEKVLSFTVRQV